MADERSFWTTVPGMLTGLAAVVTAFGTIYLGVTQGSKDRVDGGRIPPPQPVESLKRPVSYTDWPSVGSETFSDASRGWTVGNFPTDSGGRLDLRIVDGQYRWDLLSPQPATRWLESPFGSVIDFLRRR